MLVKVSHRLVGAGHARLALVKVSRRLALVTLGWRWLPLVGDGCRWLVMVAAAGQCLPLADLTATLGVTSPRWLTRRVRWNRATPGAQRWTTGGGKPFLFPTLEWELKGRRKKKVCWDFLFCSVVFCVAQRGFLL